MENTQASIDRVCEYRGLPKIKKGHPCIVDGHEGVIVGGNSSANFNVEFPVKQIRNCHPYWRMTIWDTGGNVVYQSKDD